MFRSIAPALTLSLAVHVAAAAGYWLWGNHSDGPRAQPVVEVALVMEARPAEPESPVTAPTPPARMEPKPEPEPEPEPEPVARAAESRQKEPLVEPGPPRQAVAAAPAPAPTPTPVPRRDAPEPVAPVEPGLIVSIEQAYKSALQAEIARHRSYPHIARRLRQEGTVEVGFVVLADGRLTHIELVHSSGYELLDRAAVQAVREVRQFRPIPSKLARERWNLSVPLNFRLL